MKKSTILLSLAGLAFCLLPHVSLYAANKSVTLTTYYPSPYGEYTNLKAVRSDGGTLLTLQKNSATDAREYNFTVSGTAGSPSLLLNDVTAGNVTRFAITAAGNVGIGTTAPNVLSPNVLLQVGTVVSGSGGLRETIRSEGNWNGNTGDGSLIRFTNYHTNGTNPNSLEYNLAGIGGYDYNGNWGGALAFYTAPSGTAGGGTLAQRMTIGPDGSVGIGTAAPSYTLDVTGTGRVSSTANPGFIVGNGTTGYIKLGDAVISKTSGGAFIFNGNISATGTVSGTGGGTCTCTSDLRLKKNIQTIPDALDKVSKLRGVEFEWKKDEYKEMNFTSGKHIGLIAQETEKVVPEVVSTDSKGYKSIEYANLVGLLTEAVKAQQKEIEALKKDVEALKLKAQ